MSKCALDGCDGFVNGAVETYCCDLHRQMALTAQAEAEVARLRVALGRLISAAELYAADQSKADDPRCGLSQPITVAEAEELNAALLAAGDALAKSEQEERS